MTCKDCIHYDACKREEAEKALKRRNNFGN